MIDVRVAQDHGIKVLWVEGKMAIALNRFLALPLEKTALQQEPLPVDLQQVHRSRGRASRAVEMDSHAGDIRCASRKEKCKGVLHEDRQPSYTHLRAHETPEHLVCRLLLE